jgi:hypothetical protein
MTRELKKALRRQKKQTKQEVPQLAGMLGVELGGQRIVEVPHRNGFVYVKLRDNQNEIIQAFNNKVSPSYNLPVLVERQNNRYVVIAVNTDRYQNNWTTFAPFLPRHGNTHSFDIENGGGGDIVWVQSRQLMPTLVLPSGTFGSQNVVMSSYTLKKDDGTWIYVGNTGTQTFAPYLPSSPTGAVMGLVYLDTDTGNPNFIINSGSLFSNAITGTSQIVPYIPQITSPSTQIPLAAVRLVTGTSQITWDNIYDVRQWLHAVPTGTGGGGGGTVITGTSVQDEGIPLGVVGTFNFVGNGVDVSVSGTTARVHITGSSGGGIANLTGTSIGLPNKVALTNSSGFLNTHPGLAWGAVGSNPFVEFGANVVGKVFNAGYMGYNLFSTGYMEYIGAGTGSGDRWSRFYDNVKVNERLQVNEFQNMLLKSSFTYMNATGLMVTANNAPQQTTITGSDFVMGVNGLDTSVLYPMNSFAGAIVYTDVIGTFLTNVTVPSSTTYSSCPWKPTADATTNQFPWVEGGVMSNLSFRKGPTAQPASGSLVVTLYVNSVATALTVTVPAGASAAAATFEDSTNTVVISAGDRIEWRFQNNATAASAQLTAVSMKLNKRATA